VGTGRPLRTVKDPGPNVRTCGSRRRSISRKPADMGRTHSPPFPETEHTRMADLGAVCDTSTWQSSSAESAGMRGSELVVADEWVALRDGLPDRLDAIACRPG